MNPVLKRLALLVYVIHGRLLSIIIKLFLVQKLGNLHAVMKIAIRLLNKMINRDGHMEYDVLSKQDMIYLLGVLMY